MSASLCALTTNIAGSLAFRSLSETTSEMNLSSPFWYGAVRSGARPDQFEGHVGFRTLDDAPGRGSASLVRVGGSCSTSAYKRTFCHFGGRKCKAAWIRT
jgi:hypothetical protein